MDFEKFLARGSEGVRSMKCSERSRKVRGKCTGEVTVGKSCNRVLAAGYLKGLDSVLAGSFWSQLAQMNMTVQRQEFSAGSPVYLLGQGKTVLHRWTS